MSHHSVADFSIVEGSFSITIFFPFLRYEYLLRYCRDVFNGTEDYSLAVATIVHGSLYYLFREAGLVIDDQSLTTDCAQHIELCRKNFEACLSSLNLLMPATFESVVALAIGVGVFFFSKFSNILVH